jgi:CubicO group peptidase (beta-lactamase class C family)
MQPDTPLQLGSIGKQFVATAVMMLVAQGKADLDESLRHYFSEGPESWAPKIISKITHKMTTLYLTGKWRSL